MLKLAISAENNGERLDKFLTKQLADLSRSQIQRMIKDEAILVNGKKVAPHHFLKSGDAIVIPSVMSPDEIGTSEAEESLKQEERDSSTRPARRRSVGMTERAQPQIIFENGEFLVINKPAGLLAHPRSLKLLDQEPTVVSWLVKKYPKIKKVGDEPLLRPGLAHRLDKEASGVMIIAKTQASFVHLKKQFHDRLVKKEYLAVAYGAIKPDQGTIDFSIGRAKDGDKMAARPADRQKNDRPAMTDFEVLNRRPNFTAIKVWPRTGRTHQIRVHLLALGHPLLGDPIYKIKRYKPLTASRLMLHARKLTITDTENNPHEFAAPLPPEFEKYLTL